MAEKTVTEISARMREKETDELLAIWKENNRNDWSDEAFDAIRVILTERDINLPPQPEKGSEEKQPTPTSRLGSTGFYLLIAWIIASIIIGRLRPSISGPIQFGPISINLLVLTDLFLTGLFFGSIICFVLNLINKRKQRQK